MPQEEASGPGRWLQAVAGGDGEQRGLETFTQGLVLRSEQHGPKWGRRKEASVREEKTRVWWEGSLAPTHSLQA